MISWGSLASLGSLIPIALCLNMASQDSLPKLSATSTPDYPQSHSPDNQHAASLNTSLTPAEPPPFAHNVSALIKLGLDVNVSISWIITASGNTVGIRMFILEYFLPLVCDFLNCQPCPSC